MAYVLLAMYAQERLTECYRGGLFKPVSEQEKKKYLGMEYLLQDAFAGEKNAGTGEQKSPQ